MGFSKYIETGDQVLADRRFTVVEEVEKDDFSSKVSNVRIHVERVIGRLRNWTI